VTAPIGDFASDIQNPAGGSSRQILVHPLFHSHALLSRGQLFDAPADFKKPDDTHEQTRFPLLGCLAGDARAQADFSQFPNQASVPQR
jgi:hypothetical protein